MDLIVGNEVMILGSLDNRIREKLTTGPVYGTIEQLLSEGQVSVILENNDLWVGDLRNVTLKKNQE